MTSQSENTSNIEFKTSEAIENVGLYDGDYAAFNSDEKQNFVLSNSSKSDVHTCCISEKDYLINLHNLSTDGPLKIDNSFGMHHVISSGVKTENMGIRELIINIKPLNSKIDNLNKQSENACFNSANDNCNSMEIDINFDSIAMDHRKINEVSQVIKNPVTQKSENSKDITCKSVIFVNDDQYLKNVIDNDELRVNIFEIPTSCERDTKQIPFDFKEDKEERSNEKDLNSRKIDEGFKEDSKMRDDCGTFGVTDSNYIVQEENDSMNTKIDDLEKQIMEESRKSEKGNNSMAIDITLETILIDHKSTEVKIAKYDKLDTQGDKTLQNRLNGRSCVKDDNKKVKEINDDVWSCVDGILNKLCLSKIGNVGAEDGFNQSDREKVQDILKKLTGIVTVFENAALKITQNSEMIRTNCDSNSIVNPCGMEINDSYIQNADQLSNLEEGDCDTFGTNVDNIESKDSNRQIPNDIVGNSISDAFECQNIEDEICNRKKCTLTKTDETDDTLKSCPLELKISEKKEEFKENSSSMNSNNIEKSESLRKYKSAKSDQENRDTSFVKLPLISVCSVDQKHSSTTVFDTDNTDVCKSSDENNVKKNIFPENQMEERSESIRQDDQIEERSESVSQELYESINKDKAKENISYVACCQINSVSSVDENVINNITVLDTGKQHAVPCQNSNENNCNLNLNVQNVILSKDLIEKCSSEKGTNCVLDETLKQQKSIDCNETICFNGNVIEVSDKNNFDSIIKCGNSTKIKSKQVKDNFTETSKGKSITMYQKLSVLSNTMTNKKTMKEKVMEVSALPSKTKTFPDDLDVIVISSTEDDSCDFEKSANTVSETSGENYLNTNVLPHADFHKELDNELEILKVQYFDIEKKISTAAKKFSCKEMYKSTLKVKKELTSCIQSLENLSVSLRNKLLYAKSQIPKEQAKPSFSAHQQYRKNFYEIPNEKFSYRSQAFTKLTKIESHHQYKFDSPLPPWQTIKTTHKIKKRSKQFNDSEEETSENLHKKTCKLSQFNYVRNFQDSPETNIKSCSKKCYLPKNCSYHHTAKQTEFHSYRNELDCFSGVGDFSKSLIAHREMTFAKSNPKYVTDYSHSDEFLETSDPPDKYKNSRFRSCSAQKGSGKYCHKAFTPDKGDRKYDFDSDVSDSLEISSTSDKEFSPVRTDYKATRAKCCDRTHKLYRKSNEKNDHSSKMEKYSKRLKHNQYETDEMSMSSSATDSSSEVIKSSGKKHKERRHNTGNKSGHTLIDRQMNIINKHASRKIDKIKSLQDFSIGYNTNEKYKEKDYFKKAEKGEESNNSEDLAPFLKGKRKRKTSYEQSPKHAKISHHSDLRNVLNDKQQNDKRSFHSGYVSPMPSRSVSPEEVSSPCKRNKTEYRTDIGQQDFKNKYNFKNRQKIKSYIVSPLSPSTVNTIRHGKAEIDRNSIQNFREQTEETVKRKEKAFNYLPAQSSEAQKTKYNERENVRSHYKYKDKIWGNVTPKNKNEASEEPYEDEMNNIRDYKSYDPFLKERKDTSPTTKLKNLKLKKEKDPKYESDYHEVEKTDKVLQKSRSDLAYKEDVSKNTFHAPQTSKVTEKRVAEKSDKEEPAENNDSAFVSSGKFDLFKELNREIRKCARKRKQAASKMSNFENKTVSKQNITAGDNSSLEKK